MHESCGLKVQKLGFARASVRRDHTEGMNSRVHPTYKTKYRVTNWAPYDRALVGRGDVTLWVSPAAIATCEPAGVGARGGQWKYSDIAIETALTLRLLFHLPLRQTEGFLHSLFGTMGIDLSRRITRRFPGAASTSTSRLIESRQANACISSSTARDSRSWAKGSGLLRNTEDAANEAGRSSIWVSTAQVSRRARVDRGHCR